MHIWRNARKHGSALRHRIGRIWQARLLPRYLQTNRYLRRLKVLGTVIGWPCSSTASVYCLFLGAELLSHGVWVDEHVEANS